MPLSPTPHGSTSMKISKTINLCIGIIVLWVWLSMTFRLWPLGTDSEGGFQNLRYFTVLSNLLQGGVSLACFSGRRVGRWKYASTTAMALTFCVVLFILGPMRGYDVMYSGANFWSHLVVPILSMVDFLFFDRSCTYTLRDSLFATLPLVAYGLFYTGNLIINGVEGNDWYGFVRTEPQLAVAIFAAMLAVNWGIALLLRLPGRKQGNYTR